MSYRIEWRPEALRPFVAEWDTLDFQRQRAVLQTLNDVDFQLINLPLDVGESREHSMTRVLITPPVVVAYVVDPRMRVVYITGARTIWKTD